MAIPPYQLHQPLGNKIEHRDFVRAQEQTKLVLDEVTRRPQLSASIIQSAGVDLVVTLTTGQENLVSHGLGRAVRGWRLLDNTADSRVWRVSSPTTAGYDATKHLCLSCSANTTVKLEVYA